MITRKFPRELFIASCDNRDAETKKIGLAGDCLRALYYIGGLRLFHDVVLVEGDEVVLAGVIVGADDRGNEINTFRIIGEHVIILLVDADEIDYHDAGLSILAIQEHLGDFFVL